VSVGDREKDGTFKSMLEIATLRSVVDLNAGDEA
jgi:hypothetical protein